MHAFQWSHMSVKTWQTSGTTTVVGFCFVLVWVFFNNLPGLTKLNHKCYTNRRWSGMLWQCDITVMRTPKRYHEDEISQIVVSVNEDRYIPSMSPCNQNLIHRWPVNCTFTVLQANTLEKNAFDLLLSEAWLRIFVARNWAFRQMSSCLRQLCLPLTFLTHNDVIKWKHFLRYWPFVQVIHRSPVNSRHKSQWCGALIFSDLSMNKRLSKQSWGRWFGTPSRSLWRHCNAYCKWISWNTLQINSNHTKYIKIK